MEDRFNKAQQQAICHKMGACLVLAGPGSGKTTVITKRIEYLIKEKADPRKILVVTFTKAAATEMKERFEGIIAEEANKVWFGTFHAIFFTILRYAYHYNANNIIREEQKKQFFYEILQKLELEVEDEADFISSMESDISLVKGEMLSLSHYHSITCSDEIFIQFYQEYENRLRRANLIDFDDMLVFCYELLKEREDIRKIWQQQFEYILIDEFQDINKIQFEIVKMLAAPQNNLFIVGDDDQSIYRFRGAKPEIMLHFDQSFPDTKQILLNINYRSTSNIVEAANRLISHNKERFEKKIITQKGKGADIEVRGFATLALENERTIEQIRRYREEGIPFSEMAVLVRTNIQPRAFVGKLMEFNIPFRIKDSLPNIFDHWIAKDLITYMKIASGERFRELFLRIINKPKRYIARDSLDRDIINYETLRTYYEDKKWMTDRIDKLEFDFNMLKQMPPFAAITYIQKGIEYETYLKEYADYRKMNVQDLLDTLEELKESARNFSTLEEWLSYIEEYRTELKRQFSKQKELDKDSLTIATMHSAKGLEYQAVFILDANEGIMPHKKAVVPADLEEERRLFYVGMTRAKYYLHIYTVRERYNKQLAISRFIEELLPEEEMC